MRRTVQSNRQGVRSGLWSGSKCTNLTPFHPWHSLIDAKMKHWGRFVEQEANLPFISVEQSAPGFVIPCNETDIREFLSKVPSEFLKGLKAIIVMGGSRKIDKVNKKYCYGTYCNNWIFLAALPQKWMVSMWDKGIAPNYLNRYKHAGARIEEIKGGMQVVFDESSLKRFYLQDVLMHEIGHHIDIDLESSSFRKRENFAKWFATEYGYRLRTPDP